MRRNIVPFLLILLVLGTLGGFAWLTRHPESQWLEEAQEWPLVGDLARRFRVAYLGPRAAGEGPETASVDNAEKATAPPPVRAVPARRPKTAQDAVAEKGSTQPPRPPLAASLPPVQAVPLVQTVPAVRNRAFRPAPPPALDDVSYLVTDWTWFLPGQRVLENADPEAETRTVLAAMSYLPVLGRDGRWARVMVHRQAGWIDTSWEPPYNRRKAHRGILRQRYEPVRASDSQSLKKARKILGIDRPEVKLGAYTLYTDVEDEELLAFLSLTARVAEEAYFARYGRLPSGNPKRSAVLFAKRADYHTYAGETSKGYAGHAGRGILAFFAEGRHRQTLARTLVHEITHLLNNRALARFLPLWLEEGIAGDLGSLWVEGSPDGVSPWQAGWWRSLTSVPELMQQRLAGNLEAGNLPSVAVLMSLDHKTFRGGSEIYAYTHSAAFIRYLLDGEDGRHAAGFRRFLMRIAAGHGADPRLLLKILDTEVEELDRGFHAWLRAEAEASTDRLARRLPG